MKGLTVDLVVTGDESAAVAAAVNAVGRGERVLVVLRGGSPRVAPRLRRLCRAANGVLTIMTNAEVVCVDGIGRRRGSRSSLHANRQSGHHGVSRSAFPILSTC